MILNHSCSTPFAKAQQAGPLCELAQDSDVGPGGVMNVSGMLGAIVHSVTVCSHGSHVVDSIL